MDIGPGDEAIGRARAVDAIAEGDDRAGAIRARRAAEMDLVARHGFAGRDLASADGDRRLVAAEHGVDVEEAEAGI